MWRFIVGFFAIIGIFTFVGFAIFSWSLYTINKPPFLSGMSSGDTYVLNLTLGDETLGEQPQSGGIMSLFEGQPRSIHKIIEGINYAADDKHVKGILLTLEGNVLKTAVTQEIREALKAFKAKGKFIYTYTHSFGELSNGTMNYYLAALSTKIWMMPLGTLNFNGIVIEIPFAKKALEDFKIRPQMGRREEYKGFIESITESDFTAPYKEDMQKLIDTLAAQIIKDVATDRGLEVSDVQKMLDESPYTPKEAVSRKLIDDIGYKDQMKEAIEKKLGQKTTYHSFDSYLKTVKPSSKGEKIAIIYAEGNISKGKTTKNPFSDDLVMDASEIAKMIRQAREDDSIKAIILRVDSPGGNPIASELIGREMDLTKPKKPVIVSMSNYAASGGYWISCNARKIVAQPGTVTGSIGFFAGKIVTQGFWDHYGIHWGELHKGENAAIWSTGKDYSDQERVKFESYLDQIYDIFKDKVAKGRNLTPDKVSQIAKGKIWTGAEALELGLVDAMGGLTTAIEIAKKEAGIAADAPYVLIHLPESKSILELLFKRQQDSEASLLAQYPALRMTFNAFHTLFSSPQVEMKIDHIKP